jgi:hypothetical protein
VASIHGSPYLQSSDIVNIGACIHPQHVPGSGKLDTRLMPDGFDTIDFGIVSLSHSASTVSSSLSKVHPHTPTTWCLFALRDLLQLPQHQHHLNQIHQAQLPQPRLLTLALGYHNIGTKGYLFI